MQVPVNLPNKGRKINQLQMNQIVSNKCRLNTTDQIEVAMNVLYGYISWYTEMDLSAKEQAVLRQMFRYREVRRRQYILQEGDVCRYISFVLTGALRMYSVNEKGYESVVAFHLEHSWASDPESTALHRPSMYNIEALEHCHILQITAGHFDTIGLSIPTVGEMIKRQHAHNAITTQKRIHAAISMSAEERYNDLLACNPEYVRRFPQNSVASYLGIKAETLSRLRKHL